MHLDLENVSLVNDMKHVGIEIKFYNLDTFKNQIDVNFIDLDSNLVDLNYKVASLIFCHFWRSMSTKTTYFTVKSMFICSQVISKTSSSVEANLILFPINQARLI